MGSQSKKKTFSFSLTEAEAGEVLALTNKLKFSDRNEFLLALLEAAKFLNLVPAIDTEHKRVLRPRQPDYSEKGSDLRLVAEAKQSTYCGGRGHSLGD